MRLKEEFSLHGIAHITGGGLLENLNRILPKESRAVIVRNSWPRPPLFELLQQWGRVEETEMQRVFNCGIGLMLVVPADQADPLLQDLSAHGEKGWRIGRIEQRAMGQSDLEVL